MGRGSRSCSEVVAYIAIRSVPPKQAPEGVPANRWTVLDDLIEGVQGSTARGPYPVVLAGEVDLSNTLYSLDPGLQLRSVDWVEVVREDVYLLDAEMRLVDAVRAIKHELIWSDALDVFRNVRYPVSRAVHVPPDGTQQLIASLIREYRGVFCIRQVVVLVSVCQKRLDVVLECSDNGAVRVELLNRGVGAVPRLSEVEASPAQEVVFPTMVIILLIIQYSNFH